ncbi:phage major capsid protein [Pseudoclavibacter alba]|uniref:Phage major capsid protein n=1 Tax=Pseudoclavibacter albus TaxID=272241 RepID=A0ABT2HWB7_9MICO|nr:phage major capsid protein [Pseudoclavibacter alba]MCT2042614.1 phage major capsid protein [Pseudoclavibacter alba]
MATANGAIERTDALALLARQDINEIVKGSAKTSAALSSFRTITMSAGTARMPVLAALPTAGWVSESTTDKAGLKPVSEVAWDSKELIAEELAVIVPVHENVLADSAFDIWGEVKPLVVEQFGAILDAAVLFGTNKPASWVDPALVPGAIAAGNTFAAGSGTVKDLAEDINAAMGLVEEDGFDVTAAYSHRGLKARLRGLRDANGQPIYLHEIRADGVTSSIYGVDMHFVENGSWNKAAATALVGDASKAILGIRQDVTVKLLDQATLERADGTLLHLAQRDMVALRFVFRVGYAVANPIQAGNTDIAKQFPFAVVTPAAA